MKLLDDPEVLHNFEIVLFCMGKLLPLILGYLCFYWMQKGTVVEKLVEERACDDKHLRQLIGICEGKLLETLDFFLPMDIFLIRDQSIELCFIYVYSAKTSWRNCFK